MTVGQNDVNDDGMFEFMLNTKGDTWKYDGEYVIRVQYGNPDVNNWAIVNLVGGVMAVRYDGHIRINRTCNYVSNDQISANARWYIYT